MHSTHFLVIAPESDFDPECPEYDFEVICPGVTASCRLWWACDKKHEHPAMDSDEAYDGEVVIDGEEHQVIDYDWMTPTERCYVADLFGEGGDYFDIARVVSVPGIYAVDHDWDEGVYLFLLDEEVPDDVLDRWLEEPHHG